jgi:hypothetical protein
MKMKMKMKRETIRSEAALTEGWKKTRDRGLKPSLHSPRENG